MPPPGPLVGVLALQGDVSEHETVLDDLGARSQPVRRPMDLSGVQALIIPGGESTTMSLLLQSSGLLPELEKLIADGLPILGTCAGMILLASRILDGRTDQVCLGAIDLVVRRNAFGRQTESFETDLDVVGIEGGPMHAVFIRAPIVEETGGGVEVLASVALRVGGSTAAPAESRGTDVGSGHATRTAATSRPVVCRQGPIIVAAFHPELAPRWNHPPSGQRRQELPLLPQSLRRSALG